MGRPSQAHPGPLSLLLLLLTAAAPRGAQGTGCSYSLSLSAGGGAADASSADAGWCPPYAALGSGSGVATAVATCGGIAVPPGGVLRFGTCALPGATCAGATSLAVMNATGGTVLSTDRVALNGSAAALSQGCVLGARCSYAEWRNPALSAAAVSIAEGCFGTASCAGVVAWRVGTGAALLPAAVPANATALVFAVRALQTVTLKKLSGAVASGNVAVSVFTGSPFAANALTTSSPWVLAQPSGAWSSPQTLNAPQTLTGGTTYGVLVVASAANALTCAHALGDGTSALMADAALAVSQGVAVTSPLAAGAALGAACAWRGLSLQYDVTAACAAPPPAPVALPSATIAGITLVNTLADLRAALADASVYQIQVNQHIDLDGTELTIAVTTTRTLALAGTYSCRTANPATPRCRIRSNGASRVLTVPEGVTLTIVNLELRDGVAPATENGGCVNADCATCHLTVNDATFVNCTAPSGGGGAVGCTGGGGLTMNSTEIASCTANFGGGVLDDGGLIDLNLLNVHDCTAQGSTEDATVTLGGLRGPAGGGVALCDVNGTITNSNFVNNAATTTEVVLLANPDFPQARGGGLLMSAAYVNVSGSVFSGNAAFFGGGAYVHDSSNWFSASVLSGNVATIGDGGGLFFGECPYVGVSNVLVTGNGAGGGVGGGLAAIATAIDIGGGSIFNSNSVPDGCGGAVGLDAGGTLNLAGNSVLSNNSATNGGGLCCYWCNNMTVALTTLYDNAASLGSGGAVYAQTTPSALTNVTMYGNSAPAGGGISAVDSQLTLTDCLLHDNVASQTHGGAIFHDSRNDQLESMTLTRVRFENNTCNAAGGAVAAFSSLAVTASFCNFTNNTISATSPAGGAIMSLDVTNLLIASCRFTSNSLEEAAAIQDGDPLGYLGGVYAAGTGSGGAVWIGSDEPLSAVMQDCFFSHNWAVTGGGIYLTGSVQFSMSNTYMEHCHAYGYSSEGGGILTDTNATSVITGSTFYSNEAVRGGHSWHGGTSATTYDDCTFDENEGKAGDDTKGTAIYVGENATMLVKRSEFKNQIGSGIAEGTITLGGTSASRLRVEDTVFDNNFAHLGGCLFITIPSQVLQLSLSRVTFTNNYAYVGSVMFTEAATFEDIRVSCPTCSMSLNNTASNYGSPVATPPQEFKITMPTQIRSGAPLPVNVTLLDGFGQTVVDWIDTVATIDTPARISGSLRVFYAGGVAKFKELTLRGDEGETYPLAFTLAGPDLFGNDINEKSASQNVSVQLCLPEEAFDKVRLECACADGYGLVLSDNTCRTCTADEVVPPGSLSCAQCPRLSKPISASECQCLPGHYGSVVGASGACTECPVDTYRGALDPPVSCIECPPTSHTFALASTSAATCLCGENTFNDNGGVNGTFRCARAPEGGWAQAADYRLFTLANFWRAGPNYTEFFACSAGLCKKEQPAGVNQTQLGYACREGHTGPMCSVCKHGYAYQGLYCEHCGEGLRFEEWSTAKKGGLLFLGLGTGTFLAFVLFLLPLFPRTEALFQSSVQPAVMRMERALGNVALAVRPMSANRPVSAAGRPTSAREVYQALAQRTRALTQPANNDGLRQRTKALHAALTIHQTTAVLQERRMSGSTSAHEPSSHHARDSNAMRRSSMRMGIAAVDINEHGRTSSVHVRVERPSRVRVFLDLAGEPVRIVFTFWQIVSSFSSSLYVPWPSVYYALANKLSVVSLQFLKLPTLACVQPEVSFEIIFNGVTLACFLYCLFAFSVYYFGQRSAVARRDPDRCQRFKTQCMNVFIWGLFLVYPQVSSTTLLIFACTPLSDGKSYLAADARILCYTPKHRLLMGVGAFWAVVFPLGIPMAFLYVLWANKVPELAAWKRECAWLRNIVQRALVIGVPMPFDYDPDTITTESISVEHLRVMHKVFVENKLLDPEEGAIKTGGEQALIAATAAPGGIVAALHMPTRPSLDGDERRDASRGAAEAPASAGSALQQTKRGPNRLLALLEAARAQVNRVTQKRSTTVRRKLSSMLFRDEREQLLMQLLMWAKHDKSTLVAEPRENQLRWRTYYEWRALQASNVRLGRRDAAESAAFFKYKLIFSSFSVHAWYWESVDLLYKLFLTSLVAFIAPRTVVQVIVACLFAFGMLLLTIHVKPYRERANNQLVALSVCNVFLFLFTGLLMQTDPEGITQNRIAFSVIVGGLTTSIVVFTFFLFLREMWNQLIQALLEIDEEEQEDALDAAALTAEMEAAYNSTAYNAGLDSDAESVHEHWNDGSGDLASDGGGGGGALDAPPESETPTGPPRDSMQFQETSPDAGAGDEIQAQPEQAEPPGDAMPQEPVAAPADEAGTPPPPAWVARLAAT